MTWISYVPWHEQHKVETNQWLSLLNDTFKLMLRKFTSLGIRVQHLEIKRNLLKSRPRINYLIHTSTYIYCHCQFLNIMWKSLHSMFSYTTWGNSYNYESTRCHYTAWQLPTVKRTAWPINWQNKICFLV